MAAARRTPMPCALSIAGLDPSGGAGIAADLRGFAAAGAWGCAVAAVLTVQSTAGLVKSVSVEPSLLEAQVREIFAHHPVRAVKIGALGSLANVRAVDRVLRSLARAAAHGEGFAVVLDPVLLPSRATRAPSGGRSRPAPRLLDARALAALRKLAARVTLVTPNASEAHALLGHDVRSLEGAAAAATALSALGARAALVKGGHLVSKDAVDVLAVGARTWRIEARRQRRAEVHGTGCTLSALIAGKLAVRPRGPVGDSQIVEAVRWAKSRITRGIERARRAGDGSLVIGYEGLADG